MVPRSVDCCIIYSQTYLLLRSLHRELFRNYLHSLDKINNILTFLLTTRQLTSLLCFDFCGQSGSLGIYPKCPSTRSWQRSPLSTHDGWTTCPTESSVKWLDRQTARAWRWWKCSRRSRITKTIITWTTTRGTLKRAGWWGTCVATDSSETNTRILRRKWNDYGRCEVRMGCV